MGEADPDQPSRFRATNDFEKSMAAVWAEIRALPALQPISDDRLRRELRFIWQVGGNFLRGPSRAERIRRCLVSGEKTLQALGEFLQNFRKLLHSYDLQDFYHAYDAHAVYGTAHGEKLHLPKLGSDVMDVMADIGIALEILALMPGIRVSDTGDFGLRRKVPTAPLVNIVHIVMKSWLGLTGKEFVFAKGLEKPRPKGKAAKGKAAKGKPAPEGKNDPDRKSSPDGITAPLDDKDALGNTDTWGKKHRPQQDDAYFASLCIQMVTGAYRPSTTITAINRARKNLNAYRKALADKVPTAIAESARVDFLDKLDDRMRRMIYELEYKNVRP